MHNVSHLIQPKYDTAYYTYLLEEVIAQDIYSKFEISQDGVFDKESGKQLRKYIYK